MEHSRREGSKGGRKEGEKNVCRRWKEKSMTFDERNEFDVALRLRDIASELSLVYSFDYLFQNSLELSFNFSSTFFFFFFLMTVCTRTIGWTRWKLATVSSRVSPARRVPSITIILTTLSRDWLFLFSGIFILEIYWEVNVYAWSWFARGRGNIFVTD